MIDPTKKINVLTWLPEVLENVFGYETFPSPLTEKLQKELIILSHNAQFWQQQTAIYFKNEYYTGKYLLSLNEEVDWCNVFVCAYLEHFHVQNRPHERLEAKQIRLRSLIKKRDLASIRTMSLNATEIIDVRDAHGMTALDHAAKKQYKELVTYFFTEILLSELPRNSMRNGLHWAALLGINVKDMNSMLANVNIEDQSSIDDWQITDLFILEDTPCSADQHHETPFSYAAKTDNDQLLQDFELDITELQDMLYLAAKHGSNRVINYLLMHCKAAIDSSLFDIILDNAINIAATHNQFVAVDELLRMGANANSQRTIFDEGPIFVSPLHAACSKKFAPLILLLLAQGADTTIEDSTGTTIISSAIISHPLAKISSILIKTPGAIKQFCKSLAFGSTQNDVNVIFAFIKAGIDITATHEGLAPLQWVVSNSKYSPSIANLLVFKPEDIRVRDASNRTLLHFCSSNIVFQFLLEKDKKYLALHPDEQPLTKLVDTEGNTPIHAFALRAKCSHKQHFDQKLLAGFLAEGIDLEARNIKGETALMLVAQTGNLDLFKLFLEKGADQEAANINKGILHYASMAPNNQIADYIIEAKIASRYAKGKMSQVMIWNNEQSCNNNVESQNNSELQQ